MGFDGFDHVDFIVDIEQSFGITIDDKTCEKWRTAGDVHKYLLDNLDTTQLNDYCNSQKAFYLLRRSLINDFGLKRKDIVPSRSTEALFPLSDRKKRWNILSKSLSLKLPHLLIPFSYWSKFFLTLFLLGLIFICAAWIFNRSIIILSLPLGIGGILIGNIIGISKYATLFPSSCKTIGGLSKTIAFYNSSRFSSGKYTKKEVWDILCNMIESQFEKEINEIKPETSFMRDLKTI
jgi:acyl carrier protein